VSVARAADDLLVTAKGYEWLCSELESLRTEGRRAMSKRLPEARADRYLEDNPALFDVRQDRHAQGAGALRLGGLIGPLALWRPRGRLRVDPSKGSQNERMEYFPIAEVRARLEAQNGGWEVVHESPNLEVGVLVRIAPTPDPRVRHTADEVYVVLAGEATLEAEGDSRRLRPGDAAFVPVGKEHHFVDYELISVLVLFTRAATD
jgi:mannose-6-phosphate isomerase-like protein (cupin superfamily)